MAGGSYRSIETRKWKCHALSFFMWHILPTTIIFAGCLQSRGWVSPHVFNQALLGVSYPSRLQLHGIHNVHSVVNILLFLFSVLSFWFFRSAPLAYGSSQARSRIRAVAVAASSHHSPRNPGSEPHLRPITQLTAMLILNPLSKARDWTDVQCMLSGFVTAELWRKLQYPSFYFCPALLSYSVL